MKGLSRSEATRAENVMATSKRGGRDLADGPRPPDVYEFIPTQQGGRSAAAGSAGCLSSRIRSVLESVQSCCWRESGSLSPRSRALARSREEIGPRPGTLIWITTRSSAPPRRSGPRAVPTPATRAGKAGWILLTDEAFNASR